MEELVQRVCAATGIEPALAQKAIGLILNFLSKEAPQDHFSTLINAIPGASEAMAEANAAPSGGGGLMGMVGGLMGGGGGVMGLGAQLMGAGVSMDQIGGIGKELFAYGREKAGEDTMGGIVAHIPGLAQFV
jgi:hypothetical protein